jgi:hypothetical protein
VIAGNQPAYQLELVPEGAGLGRHAGEPVAAGLIRAGDGPSSSAPSTQPQLRRRADPLRMSDEDVARFAASSSRDWTSARARRAGTPTADSPCTHSATSARSASRTSSTSTAPPTPVPPSSASLASRAPTSRSCTATTASARCW